MAELSTSQVFGDLTVTGLTKTSVLQSLIGTGTAPLIVASTTLVNNLNSDLLDGFHGDLSARTNTYVLRGSTLANLQVVGLSTSFGLASGVDTGGINVVMGTGASATWLVSGTSAGVFRGGVQLLDSGTNIRLYTLTGYLDVSSAGLVTSSGGFSGSLTGNASTATTLQTARTIAISGDGVGTATSFNGSANITIPFTLANVATAGTYRSVTINAKGLVTAGTNPTTLSDYGITDATPSSHVGTNGAAHAVVTTSVNGFMSATDKVNLDKVPLLGQGLRNSFLCDGGQLNWGTTANVFSWSKAYNIYPAQGTLILNGLPFKKLTIAASSVTLPTAGQCAYITVPTAYSDAPNLVGSCTMAVADATTVSGTDKIILYVRDADSCLQGWDGWIVYGTIVQAGGKRDAYVENLYTAASDFIVGVGSKAFAKKTLAETRAILGATANTASTLVLRDASGNFTAGTITATAFSGNATSASKVNSLLTRGTGLTGNNFDGSAATTWAVSYGTTAGTACQGNDSRLSDSRVASDVYAWAKASTKPTYTYSEVGAPSVTGVNASGSWGINITGNAVTAGGLAVHSGRNNEANKIVRTDSNGDIQAGWINTTSGDSGTTAITKIYASSDDYLRYYTPANFISLLNLIKGDDVRLSNSRNASDVYAWAKASTKPSYDFSEIANKPNTLAGYGITDALSLTGGTINGDLSVTGNGTFGGFLAVTGDVTFDLSDTRLKTEFEPIKNALEKIKKLDVGTYYYNDLAREFGFTKTDRQVGLKAQQVQTVLPEAVALAPFDRGIDGLSKSGEDYLTVRYEKLVPLLVEAVKEQAAEIEKLKTELEVVKHG